ncbi:response regulator [Bradyrhizobium sp. 179]|nr:response regulator [Bradyrhizobium sp. 179]
MRLSPSPPGTTTSLGRSTLRSKCHRDERPVSVLLVEDDPLIREFVVEALRDAGYHVIHASTGEEALAWCKRHAADVLVTDIRLPGDVDGWQIAERCREHDPDLPVIYATGFSPTTPRPVPGSRTLRKPFHPDEIVRMVKELGGGNRTSPH